MDGTGDSDIVHSSEVKAGEILFFLKEITLPGFFSRTNALGCCLSGVDYLLFIGGYLGLLFSLPAPFE